MSRKAYLANHFSPEELKQKYFSSQDSIESRRWHLLWKIACGWSIKNSAIAVGISYPYAQKIVKKYNQQGDDALMNGHKTPKKHRRGKKSLLDEAQFYKLVQEFKSHNTNGSRWTGPQIARWIEQETGTDKIWNQRGWDYLKKVQKFIATNK